MTSTSLILLNITANGRIPAIIDRTVDGGNKTKEMRVFEGQAILLYLTQKYDKENRISFPFDTDKYTIIPPLSILIRNCSRKSAK